MKVYIKIDKKIIKFRDTEIKKQKFHQPKSIISINNINIKKIVESDKVSFDKKGFKHFIGYKDSKKIRSLCLLLPEMSACWWDFDKIKYMSFSIIDDELLEEYNEVW